MMGRFRMVLTMAGAFGVFLVLVTLVPSTWWAAGWRLVTANWLIAVLAVVSMACLAVGGRAGRRAVVELVRREPSTETTPTAPPKRSLRPIPFWMVPAGALLVAVITWGAVWWLQGSVPTSYGDFERARLRVETIRTGLSVGAGAAGALALLLAFRRQQVTELNHLVTEYDAAERRITEL